MEPVKLGAAITITGKCLAITSSLFKVVRLGALEDLEWVQ